MDLFPHILPLTRSVMHSLLSAIPTGGEDLLVCGTRVRSTRKPFLAGTIAEKLLRHAPFPVKSSNEISFPPASGSLNGGASLPSCMDT